MSGLKWKITYPTSFTLDIDKEKLTGRVATEVAKEIRSAAKSGSGVDGRSLPKGKDGGRPLWDTGETVKSIKAVKKKGKPTVIQPVGYRSDRAGKPHALVVNSLAKQLKQNDLFGTQSEAAKKLVQDIANKLWKRAKEDRDFRFKVKRKRTVRKG